jgi:hypothetical protein
MPVRFCWVNVSFVGCSLGAIVRHVKCGCEVGHVLRVKEREGALLIGYCCKDVHLQVRSYCGYRSQQCAAPHAVNI